MTRLRSTMPAPDLEPLPFGERLLLWGIRLWAAGFKGGENVQEVLRHGFKLAGVSHVHPALDDLMHLIATTATQSIDIQTPASNRISDDEHLLLGVIAAWQEGRGKDQGTAILSSWLPLAAIRLAQPAALQIARALAGNGLHLRPRCHRLAPKSVPVQRERFSNISPTLH